MLKQHLVLPTQVVDMSDKVKDEAFILRIREIVAASGGQNGLAKTSGVKQQNIARYLSGSEPTRPQLIALAKASGRSISWLATGKEEPATTTTTSTTTGGQSLTSGRTMVDAQGCGQVLVNSQSGGQAASPGNVLVEVSPREMELLRRIRLYWSPAQWARIEDELDRHEQNYG